jgi:hypothetical protein
MVRIGRLTRMVNVVKCAIKLIFFYDMKSSIQFVAEYNIIHKLAGKIKKNYFPEVKKEE